ncbi:unnamed protein product [Diamesa serratosioi]
MYGTTRSGLIASPRKFVPRTIDVNLLISCAITRPAPFSLKPLAGLYNPYSKGCSVLCNHPPKHSWVSSFNKNDMNSMDLPEHVPEEFFRRYTDTDSRPLTPTPTIASARTRTSIVGGGSHLSVRRCVTPEPVSSDGYERKQIILDLRRSHSQETLYWNASSEMSPRHPESVSSSWLQSQQIKNENENDDNKKEEIGEIVELDEEEEEIFEEINMETTDYSNVCINARENDDDDTPRRRGKRRKKSKANIQMITFQNNNDPETQVAQLGPDSLNNSARPSIIPDSSFTDTPILKTTRKTDDFYNVDNSFFLDEKSLKTLRMGLDVEIVEGVFERYRHRTLQEVLRTISPDKLGVDSDAVREIKESLNLPEMDHEKWMHLPRRYMRSSARFELPMDTKEFGKLTPMDYLSKFVFVVDDKKQLYQRIFIKYLPIDKITRDETENEDLFSRSTSAGNQRGRRDEQVTRLLPEDVLNDALQEVLGFHGTDEKICEIRSCLQLEDLKEVIIDFRTFCGFVAFSERLITTLDQTEDPRNEIEIADFESLERHYNKIENNDMKRLLDIIQK